MSASTVFHSGSSHEATPQAATFRWLCFVLALATVAVGIGFYRQLDWATSLWPWPDARMTYIFLASLAASNAAPILWAAWRNEPGVLDVLALETMFGSLAIGAYLLWLAFERRDLEIATFGIGFLVVGAVSALLYRLTRKIAIGDPRRLPAFFRIAFAVICGILILVGTMLTFQRPNVFPWNISPETSTLIGLIFLGAALLFALIVANPMWAYGEMALTAFIAYDIVLFVPYWDLLRNINDTAILSSYYGSPYALASPGSGVRETNLIVYISVLAASSALAISIYVWGAMERRGGGDSQAG